jgi:phage terminase large subunit GpA-like protein
MIPLARALTESRYREVVGVLGTQMGKTDTIANVMGHGLDEDPSPMLYIGPTRTFVEETWEPRFVAMVDSSRSLAGKMLRGKKERITLKRVAGVKVRFGWAGSATSLAGEPARKIMVDEVDRMGDDVEGEGDPVELAHERHSTYADGQVGAFSTPTRGSITSYRDERTGRVHWSVQDDPEQIGSRIWRRWQEGTRHEFMWPCPACSKPFAPRLADVRHPDGVKAETVYRVTIACPHCGFEIDEEKKLELNARGVAIAPGQWLEGDVVKGPEPDSDCYSLWVSGLCSPWRSWLVAMRRLMRAREVVDREREQAVINTNFGECYSLSLAAPDWQMVRERCKSTLVAGQLPKDARVITCAVDVQQRRLVYSVRAWGPSMESWGIEVGELFGETDHAAVWGALAALLYKTWDGLPIACMFVDSGFRPGDKFTRPVNEIYAFCRRNLGRAWPTKGWAKLEKPLKPAKIDIQLDSRTIKDGLELWHIDSDYFKTWVHGRLEWPLDQPGRFTVNASAPDDYFKQLVAEVRQAVGSKIEWTRVRAENHYLDVEALNAAAAFRLNLHIAMPSNRVGGIGARGGRVRRRTISEGVDL